MGTMMKELRAAEAEFLEETDVKYSIEEITARFATKNKDQALKKVKSIPESVFDSKTELLVKKI